MASHYKAPNWLPAFTRRREIFAGRLAILGFAAACAFEVCARVLVQKQMLVLLCLLLFCWRIQPAVLLHELGFCTLTINSSPNSCFVHTGPHPRPPRPHGPYLGSHRLVSGRIGLVY
jgi:hypothetical protein